MVCSSIITERRHRVRPQIQVLGFYLAGFLCLVLAVLKLTIEGHWSWWRVLLPLSVVLGHNALYITVGFVWLFLSVVCQLLFWSGIVLTGNRPTRGE